MTVIAEKDGNMDKESLKMFLNIIENILNGFMKNTQA